MFKDSTEWFMSLSPEEQAVVREDKWMLAERAFQASKATGEWSTVFPKEEGTYWFYGYRFGKISCGHKETPMLLLVNVLRTFNSFMYVSEGQFMFEGEVEEPHFIKADLPTFPKMES